MLFPGKRSCLPLFPSSLLSSDPLLLSLMYFLDHLDGVGGMNPEENPQDLVFLDPRLYLVK